MNRFLLLLLIIFICFSLIACWNYRELDSIYIVSGLAIDKNKETGLYDVSVEVVNIKDTDFEPNINSQIIEFSGEAVFEAVRDMIRASSKKLYFGHATTLVVSEDVAKEGILPAIDWIARDQEPRLSIEVFISREETAKEILDTKSLATDIRLFEIDTMVSQNRNIIEVPVLQVYELINQLAIPKTHSVLPTIIIASVHGNQTNVLSGGAVLNKDRLEGYLSEEDILPYLFIRDNAKSGQIKVHNDNSHKDIIILEIFDNTTKIDYTLYGDNIKFYVKTNTEVSIGELNTKVDYISELGRNELRSLAEESLKSDIEGIIKKVQDEFGLDIFGFGNLIRKRDPKVWKQIEKDWDTIFREIDVQVDCNINIRNSGHIFKPIEVIK